MENSEAENFSCLTDGVDKKGGREISMPLMMLQKGESGIIAQKVMGGHGACRRLNELGLIPGTRIEMINKINGGPVIIRVKGSKLALGRGLANKIRVIIE